MSQEFSPFGLDLFGDPIVQDTSSPVAKQFIVAPFSVMNAREGYWQERKRAWLGCGIKSEVGRGENLLGYSKTCSIDKDTSIFDQVLCEVIYRWFASSGMQIVDPFAGGSVRGIVAACLGRNYWGSELREEQVEANRKQADDICQSVKPAYVCGDSMDTLADAPEADLIFSCPPYGDLEVYSDDPRDLSNMEWHTFLANYYRIRREHWRRSCMMPQEAPTGLLRS